MAASYLAERGSASRSNDPSTMRFRVFCVFSDARLRRVADGGDWGWHKDLAASKQHDKSFICQRWSRE